MNNSFDCIDVFGENNYPGKEAVLKSVLNADGFNYVYNNGHIKQVDTLLIEFLKVDLNKKIEQKGGADNEDVIELQNFLDTGQFTVKTLMLFPLNPVNVLYNHICSFLPSMFWIDRKNYISNYRSEYEDTINQIVKHLNFYDIEDRRTLKNDLIQPLKNILLFYQDDNVDAFLSNKKENTIVLIELDVSTNQYTYKTQSGDREKEKKEFKENDLIDLIANPVEVIKHICENRVAGESTPIERVRWFLDCMGIYPFCCNIGCYKTVSTELKPMEGKDYKIIKQGRQACSTCDTMRTKFNGDKFYNTGFRLHAFNDKLFFIRTNPIIIKKPYCQNAIPIRTELINKSFDNDALKIQDFNTYLQIRNSKKITSLQFPKLKDNLVQCPLNLIEPKWQQSDLTNPSLVKQYTEQIGLSTIYSFLTSNCYDQDHISGSHADNVVSNLWTLCKICHSQKTLLSGDFGSKKKGVANISTGKTDDLNKKFIDEYNKFFEIENPADNNYDLLTKNNLDNLRNIGLDTDNVYPPSFELIKRQNDIYKLTLTISKIKSTITASPYEAYAKQNIEKIMEKARNNELIIYEMDDDDEPIYVKDAQGNNVKKIKDDELQKRANPFIKPYFDLIEKEEEYTDYIEKYKDVYNMNEILNKKGEASLQVLFEKVFNDETDENKDAVIKILIDHYKKLNFNERKKFESIITEYGKLVNILVDVTDFLDGGENDNFLTRLAKNRPEAYKTIITDKNPIIKKTIEVDENGSENIIYIPYLRDFKNKEIKAIKSLEISFTKYKNKNK